MLLILLAVGFGTSARATPSTPAAKVKIVLATPFVERAALGSFTLSEVISDSGAVRTRSVDGSVGHLARTLLGRRGAIGLDLTSTAVGDLFTS